MGGSLDLTIRFQEILSELRIDRNGLDVVLETVRKSLRMTSDGFVSGVLDGVR